MPSVVIVAHSKIALKCSADIAVIKL